MFCTEIHFSETFLKISSQFRNDMHIIKRLTFSDLTATSISCNLFGARASPYVNVRGIAARSELARFPTSSAFSCPHVRAQLLAINMRLTAFMKKQWSGTSHERKQITETLHYWWGACRMQFKPTARLPGCVSAAGTGCTAWKASRMPQETACGDFSVSSPSAHWFGSRLVPGFFCLTDVISAARHQVYLPSPVVCLRILSNVIGGSFNK